MAEYESEFGKEILQIVGKINDWTREQGLSRNLFHTKTLCHCYLHSIGQLIKGTIAAISVRDVQVYDIVSRSLVEYLLDMMLIAKRDDESLNRRFATYHKLTLYARREIVDHYRNEFPRVERDYYNSLVSEYPDLLEANAESESGIVIPDWKGIGKEVEGLCKTGWTGLNFWQKLVTVLVEEVSGRQSTDDPVKQWQRTEAALQRVDIDEWADLSFVARADRVLRTLQGQAGSEQSGFESMDPFLTLAQKQFKFGSESVHPTPRSVVPHLNLERDSFELEYDFDNEALRDAEQFLFFVVQSSVEAASPVFGPKDGQTLADSFHRWTLQSKQISEWFFNKVT